MKLKMVITGGIVALSMVLAPMASQKAHAADADLRIAGNPLDKGTYLAMGSKQKESGTTRGGESTGGGTSSGTPSGGSTSGTTDNTGTPRGGGTLGTTGGDNTGTTGGSATGGAPSGGSSSESGSGGSGK